MPAKPLGNGPDGHAIDMSQPLRLDTRRRGLDRLTPAKIEAEVGAHRHNDKESVTSGETT
jgi:hypothetical protein